MSRILQGDWIEQLRTLPDRSIQCVITSPPYWGLRDYRNPPWDWPEFKYQPMAGLNEVLVPAMSAALGLEDSPEAFVGHLAYGFREIYRVLRDDGTCWLNLGDGYASTAAKWGGSQGNLPCRQNTNRGSKRRSKCKFPEGIGHKDLCGIPWRVAFALQADGWYLRSDIIWHKPNPMPESVTDRPTKSHEYIFLLSKKGRYFYDAEAIREPASGTAHDRGGGLNPKARANGPNSRMVTERTPNGMEHKPNPSAWNVRSKQNESFSAAVTGLVSNRNKRSVWTVRSQPYSEAHFATFPEDLIKPCILAGTSARGACSKCGAPWERIVKTGQPDLVHQKACGADRSGQYHGQSTKEYGAALAQDASATKARILAGMCEKKTVGWKPTCKCRELQTVPCVVLDPFLGSGTTALVAMELARDWIGIDCNAEYLELARERTRVTPGLALS